MPQNLFLMPQISFLIFQNLFLYSNLKPIKKIAWEDDLREKEEEEKKRKKKERENEEEGVMERKEK